jgi:large subunit ribosomal protein L17
MLRGMVTLLLENGQIETTLTRAKEVRSIAEKMITLGKKNTLASRRAALAYITKEDVVTKLFSQIAPAYANRQGGYTQIFKLGARRGGYFCPRLGLLSHERVLDVRYPTHWKSHSFPALELPLRHFCIKKRRRTRRPSA